MAENIMAYPELRHPFEAAPVHAGGSTTILHEGTKVTLANTGTSTGDGDALLIDPADLTRVNGFELKPEGACRGDLCIPLPAGAMVEQDGKNWFNLTAFADHVGQPYVADIEARVWSFGEVPARRDGMRVNAMAPDIELTDRSGKVIRLADLKGKKAMIVTWSSW